VARPVRQSSGRFRYQPMGPRGRRLSFRWGKVTDNQAAEIAGHIDALIIAAESAVSVPRRTAQWLSDTGDELHAQLAAARLVEPRRSAGLGAFIDDYCRATDNKPATVTRWKSTRTRLVEYFGAGVDLRTISPEQARAWHRWLSAERGLSDATRARDTGIARQFFNEARRRGFVQDNPFDGLSAVVKPDKDRQRYIDPQTAGALLDACPDAQWRALVTMARWGGLRVPSEARELRWSDIHWDRDRFTVRSPKTEHHADGDRRSVPLFPEVRDALSDLLELAEPGDDRVFTLKMGQGSALRKPFLAIIAKAGVEAWPKLWQNLRSSCQTDLANRFPQHQVCAWMGNSEKIADVHYLQVTEADFIRAAKRTQDVSEPGARSGAEWCSTEMHRHEKTRLTVQEPTLGCTEAGSNGRYRTRTCDPQCVILVR
jgi:integrase